jgi:hypothetical protein
LQCRLVNDVAGQVAGDGRGRRGKSLNCIGNGQIPGGDALML